MQNSQNRSGQRPRQDDRRRPSQRPRQSARKKSGIPILPVIAAVIIIILLILVIRQRGGKSDSASETSSAVTAEAGTDSTASAEETGSAETASADAQNASYDSDVEQGVAVLKQLEGQSLDDVEAALKAVREQRIQEQCEERIAELESGDINVWTLFSDYCLLGDSRAVGFSYFGFLPEEYCLTQSGATIRHLQEHIPDIVAINPATIFLCYGLNDVSIGLWPTPEDYVAEYADTIAQIKEQLPDTAIYISSILPARDPAFQRSTKWYDIPEYSEAVCEMCDTIDNCYYVDNTDICDEYADLWEVDGIHVQKPFYPYWATNLITAVYRNELISQDDTLGG